MNTNINFFIVSDTFLLRIRNVPDKSCRENQNTHILCSITFFPENCAVYVTIWKNIVESYR